MPKLATLLLSLFLTATASAATIEPGLYVAPERMGEGYAIEEQGGRITLAGFLASGWVYANAPYALGDGGFPQTTAPLYRSDGSQAGTVSIVFTSSRDAALTIGGSTLTLQRFAFSDTANPLIGQWAGAYSIGAGPTYRNTFGFFVAFTTVGQPVNAGGTGLVTGLPGTYGGECYASGSLAGTCLVVQSSSSSFVEAYVFRWPVNEWRGAYSIVTGSRQPYRMQALRVGQPGDPTAFGLGVSGGAQPLLAASSSAAESDGSAIKLALDAAGRDRITIPGAGAEAAPALASAAAAIAAALSR